MKPTVAELNRRVEETKQALLSGMPRFAIVQNLTVRYDVATRTIDNYIAKAREALEDDLAAARPYMLAEHIAHRRDLRRRFRQASDLHGELKAAQDEAKLLMLYEMTVRVKDWRDEVIALLKDGRITPEDVTRELGDELATELFNAAGIPAGQSRED
jgi:hypothetical protein